MKVTHHGPQLSRIGILALGFLSVPVYHQVDLASLLSRAGETRDGWGISMPSSQLLFSPGILCGRSM